MEKMTQKEFEINCKIDSLLDKISANEKYIREHRNNSLYINKIERCIDNIETYMKQIEELREK